MEPIILASASPRRQDFFRLLKLPFTIMPAFIDETPAKGLSPVQAAQDIALKKVLSVANNSSSNPGCKWIFAADTIVTLNREIFGKPANRDAAQKMLETLAGRRHKVITAMALYNRRVGQADCRTVSATVDFAPLSEDEIEWYLDMGEWQGAAGAYRLQEFGSCFISSIKGSPSAVAGLPLHDFYVMLKDNGYYFRA
ncbi:MAG: Maf family protein [Treponema sp.]|nr:Maf family protein [Treponema sp.]